MKKFDLHEAGVILQMISLDILMRPVQEADPGQWSREGIIVATKLLPAGGKIEVGYMKFPHKFCMFCHASLSKKVPVLEQQMLIVTRLISKFPTIQVSYDEDFNRDWNNGVLRDEKSNKVTRVTRPLGAYYPIEQAIAEIEGTAKPRYRKFEHASDYDKLYASL